MNNTRLGSFCPSGEIGRRTVFRSQRREACWFESSLGHQKLQAYPDMYGFVRVFCYLQLEVYGLFPEALNCVVLVEARSDCASDC